MRNRRSTSLGFPPDTSSTDVPTVPRPGQAWRAHRKRAAVGQGAWWFSTDGQGRFDVPDPTGTCYLASSPEGALRERLGPRLFATNVVHHTVVDCQVSLLDIPDGPALADTLASAAVRVVGLTREISTTPDYALTQVWARFFLACGCGGVRYQPRHTTGEEESYAVFGAGQGDATAASPPEQWLPGVDVAARAGLRVVSELPSRGEITSSRPPNTEP